MLLYLGQTQMQMVIVPDFVGLDRQQAEMAAEELGLNILITGNGSYEETVQVVKQSVPPGTETELGTTIQLELIDIQARD